MDATYKVVKIDYNTGPRWAILKNGSDWVEGSITYASEDQAFEAMIRTAAAAALGSVRSERKAKAARENGKKGGRPGQTSRKIYLVQTYEGSPPVAFATKAVALKQAHLYADVDDDGYKEPARNLVDELDLEEFVNNLIRHEWHLCDLVAAMVDHYTAIDGIQHAPIYGVDMLEAFELAMKDWDGSTRPGKETYLNNMAEV